MGKSILFNLLLKSLLLNVGILLVLLEIAQKIKVVKNFEKMSVDAHNEGNLTNKFIPKRSFLRLLKQYRFFSLYWFAAH